MPQLLAVMVRYTKRQFWTLLQSSLAPYSNFALKSQFGAHMPSRWVVLIALQVAPAARQNPLNLPGMGHLSCLLLSNLVVAWALCLWKR